MNRKVIQSTHLDTLDRHWIDLQSQKISSDYRMTEIRFDGEMEEVMDVCIWMMDWIDL